MKSLAVFNFNSIVSRRKFLASVAAGSFIAGSSARSVDAAPLKTPRGRTLLSDDFSTGSTVSSNLWKPHIGDGSYYGRTQIRPALPTVNGGLAILRCSNFNPSGPGKSFFGDEMISRLEFTPPSSGGLHIEFRARLDVSVPGGLVFGLFLYKLLGTLTRNEIDFELLTNDLVAGNQRVLTNYFPNLGFSSGGFPSYAQCRTALSRWRTYVVQIFGSGEINWFVDGATTSARSLKLPKALGPMNLHMNLWAPANDWPAAYGATIAPVKSAQSAATWAAYIDYVLVREI